MTWCGSGLALTHAMEVRPAPAERHDCPQIDRQADLYLRTLHKACEKAGGVGPLASLLGVRTANVTRWLDSEAPVPQAIFLKAVDVLVG
jgi:hypothetical protein